MAINFRRYPYVPELLCSVPEHMAYRELSELTKARLLPLFAASRIREAEDFEAAFEQIRQSAGQRPFILELDKRPAPPPYEPQEVDIDQQARIDASRAAQLNYNSEIASLLEPEDGFENWRSFVAGFAHAIPVLQFSDPTSQARQILRQAAMFAAEDRQMALRIDRETPEAIYAIVGQIISILPSPSDLLLIFDCGAGRQQISRRAEFAQHGIARVMAVLDVSEQSEVAAVCLSSSYPRQLNVDALELVESCDWRIWEEASSNYPFAFGDHAGVSRQALAAWVPRDWRPTVVFPLDEGWLINRDANMNDEQGWVRGASAIVGDPRFDGYPNNWGAGLLRSAAEEGSLAGVQAPRFWHAAKVNMHLNRQLDHAQRRLAAWGEETEE